VQVAAAEIQREADRLHLRLSQVGGFRDPARNPFRFAARQRAAIQPAPRPEPAITVQDLPADRVPEEPTLRLTLSGIAEDVINEETIRTAIISTPSDLILAKVDEEIGGQYKVASIGADFVELTRLDTGVVVRLALKP
jgi:hypothetical protein